MLDNRLGYIGNFASGTIEKMSQYRTLFIDLDNHLKHLGDTQQGHRQLSLARTHLETALMFCIKTIAIQGEKK